MLYRFSGHINKDAKLRANDNNSNKSISKSMSASGVENNDSLMEFGSFTILKEMLIQKEKKIMLIFTGINQLEICPCHFFYI